MDEEEKAAVLNHFDTNNNGFIRYNEFVWAFYNKRKLISQWRLQKGPGKRSDATLLNAFLNMILMDLEILVERSLNMLLKILA